MNNIAQDPSLVNYKIEFKKIFLDIIDSDSIKKNIKVAYLNTFTENEIEEMIKFNQSALGQKILKKMPELNQQVMIGMHENLENNKKKIQDLFVKIAINNKEEHQ